MDAKQIAATVKELNKAAAGGETKAMIATLDKLKKNVVISEDLLRQTKVGVAVNRHRQSSDKEVASLAAQLVSKWRDDVKGKQSPGAKDKETKTNGSGDAAAGAGAGAANAKITVAPEQRDWKKDNVDIKRTGNSIRDNCMGLIYNGLCFMSEESPSIILKKAAEVERAAMQLLGPETESKYKEKLRSLFQNLKNKSNPDLRRRILNGEITPERFINMNHEELKSAERRAEDEKIEKENMNKAMVAQAEKSVSVSLQCGKCGQRKVSYSQAQTRSADEPMTTFCECVLCGHRWKQ